MIGWAAFFELEHEENEKEQKRAQTNSALRAKRGRIR
tara:strand:+ start:446 stop:556 length:111 start_codon:yes stop_codon:yes gene_type:complete